MSVNVCELMCVDDGNIAAKKSQFPLVFPGAFETIEKMIF